MCHDDGCGYDDDDDESVGEGRRDDIRALSHRSNEEVEEKEEGDHASAAQGPQSGSVYEAVENSMKVLR